MRLWSLKRWRLAIAGSPENLLALRHDEEATLVAEAERRGLTLMVGHLLQ